MNESYHLVCEALRDSAVKAKQNLANKYRGLLNRPGLSAQQIARRNRLRLSAEAQAAKTAAARI